MSGPVDIDVPRDRDVTFEPVIVRKHQRPLGGVDDMVLALSAKGLTTEEISAHLAEVYGTTVSSDTISAITDRVIAELTDCSHDRSTEASADPRPIQGEVVRARWGRWFVWVLVVGLGV